MDELAKVDVPSTLAGVLQARLDSLPIHERTVLQQASVVGRLFWDRIVSYIQEQEGNGYKPQLIPLALTSLRNRELVYRHEESVFVGAIEYIFKHDVLREVTYESVIMRHRKTYHGLVADWLIANSGDRIGEYSGLIADHLLTAGRKDQACEYFRFAGDIALASYANIEAEGYYRQGLNLVHNESLRADILSGLGETLYRQGLNIEAKSVWQEAIKLYQELGDSDQIADIYARLSKLLWDREGYLKAWNICQKGLESMEEAQDSPGYARLLAEAGRMAFFCNFDDEVLPYCQRASEMAERVGEMEVVADTRITLALFDEYQPKAIKDMEEMVDFSNEHGILSSALRAHLNLGYLVAESLVDLDVAKHHTLQAIEISNQIGEIKSLGILYGNACESMIWMGELNRAEQTNNEFFSKYPVSGTRMYYYFHRTRAQLLFTRGEWKKAKNEFQTICEEIRQSTFLMSIAGINFLIANSILELDRFGSVTDLSKAESALKENIDVGGRLSLDSKFLLVVVYLHQDKMSAAKDQFALAQDGFSPAARDNNLFRVLCANAENELALAEGHWDKAVEASRTSIEIYNNCHHRWGWARKLIDLGDAFVGRNEPGDLERAREAYQQSLDMYTKMGAPGYIKVLEERLGDL
jgi:tetratricopeptide (TPR) repeat protein